MERLRNVPHERSRRHVRAENDSRANNNIRETLGIFSLTEWDQNVFGLEMASGFAITRASEYPE